MEAQRVLNLGPGLLPDVATGAYFTAILAWPTLEEGAAFQSASEELIGRVVRKSKANAPAEVADLILGWPQLDWQSITTRADKARPALGYLEKRLKQRIAAAIMGIAIMHHELFEVMAELPPTFSATSIDQMCKLIRKHVSIYEANNIEKQVWRTSLPILHVAMAAQLLHAGRTNDEPLSSIDLQDVQFYREVVKLGGLLEQAVHEHPKVAMTRDRMTVLRWFD